MASLKRRTDEEIKTALHRELGKHLHVMFDPIANDKLPPRLLELMFRLDERECTNSTPA